MTRLGSIDSNSPVVDGSIAGVNERTLTSGVWVTPNASGPSIVYMKLVAQGFSGGDHMIFDLEIRDELDATISGFPLRESIERGEGEGGSEDVIRRNVTLYVAAGFDYRVTDASVGLTSSSMVGVEVLI